MAIKTRLISRQVGELITMLARRVSFLVVLVFFLVLPERQSTESHGISTGIFFAFLLSTKCVCVCQIECELSQFFPSLFFSELSWIEFSNHIQSVFQILPLQTGLDTHGRKILLLPCSVSVPWCLVWVVVAVMMIMKEKEGPGDSHCPRPDHSHDE